MKEGERGAALITVLLLVAVMSALIALSFDRLTLSIKRENNRIRADEARFNLFGAETIAASRIAQLQASAPSQTSGAWQNQPVSVAVPGGRVSARLSDGGNCFNLNSLVTAMPNGQLVAQPVTVDQFVRLATVLGVSPSEAPQLANALADWIDSDSETLAGGAEDAYYQRSSATFRTPNVPLHDVSDVTLVRGMTANLFERLKPFLCALPTQDLPSYNVNTLTLDKAPLVTMFFPGARNGDAVIAALRNRPPSGFASVQDFLSQPSLKGTIGTGSITAQLRVRSDWFTLEMMSELDSIRLSETVLIDGRFAPVRIVRRRFGEF